jgi:hypothetical protein
MLSSVASARVENRVTYSKSQAYSTALRYLRVELGYNVTEKDAEAAYLLFEYTRPNQKKQSFGTIEIVQVDQAVKVFVQLPEMPEYYERVMADGLIRKLKSDYGEAPETKKEPPAKQEKPEKSKDGAQKSEEPPPNDGDSSN